MLRAQAVIAVVLGLMSSPFPRWFGVLADEVITDNSVDGILVPLLLSSMPKDNGDGGVIATSQDPNATTKWNFLDPDFLRTWTPPPLPDWLLRPFHPTTDNTSLIREASVLRTTEQPLVLSMGIDPFMVEIMAIPPPPPSSSSSPSQMPSTNLPGDSDSIPKNLQEGVSESADRIPTTATPKTTKSTTDGRRVLGIDPFQEILRLLAAQTTSASTTTATTTTSTASITTTMKSTPETSTMPTSTHPSTISNVTSTIATSSPKTTLANEASWDQNYTTTTMFTTMENMINITVENGETFAPNLTSPAGQRYTVYRMCGYPAICDQSACRLLDTTRDPMEMCETSGARVGFIFVVVLMALVIIIGNLLLPLVVWKNKELRTHHNLTKVSLAFADIITGLILLFSVIPNVIRTMESTEQQLGENDKITKNSAEAIIAGSMLTLSAQASLFHLTYLSVERFVAIKWPLWHRFKGPQSMSTQIFVIWALAFITAYIPAAFKDHFSFRYLPVLFVYILTASSSASNVAGAMYLVLTMAVPFVITVTFTFLTGIVVWRKLSASHPMMRYKGKDRHRGLNSTTNGNTEYRVKHMQAKHKEESRKIKPEVAVFKTLGVMIIGFSLTLLPFIIVVNLFYSGRYDCSTYAVPYAAAFYACMSNSFVNVLVYTVRDEKFRMGLKRVLSPGNGGSWNTQKTKSATLSTSMPSPHPLRMTTVSSEKERWERALVGQ